MYNIVVFVVNLPYLNIIHQLVVQKKQYILLFCGSLIILVYCGILCNVQCAQMIVSGSDVYHTIQHVHVDGHSQSVVCIIIIYNYFYHETILFLLFV